MPHPCQQVLFVGGSLPPDAAATVSRLAGPNVDVALTAVPLPSSVASDATAIVVCAYPTAEFDVLAAARRQGSFGGRLLAVAPADDLRAIAATLGAGADDCALGPGQLTPTLARQLARGAVSGIARQPTGGDLVQTVPGIVWEADAATLRFTFVSDHAERLLGYPIARWLQEPDFWERHLHPEDRHWALQLCRRAQDAGTDHEFSFRMLAQDGRVVWLHKVVRVVHRNGRLDLLRGVMFDIGERVRSEADLRSAKARLESALQIGRIGTFAVDFRAGTTIWDPSLVRLFGRSWDPTRGAHVASFLEHVHVDDRAEVEARLRACVANGGSMRHEFRYQRSCGSVLWVAGTVSAERDAEDKVVRLLGAITDVTEQRRLEQLRREQGAVLEMIAAGAPLRATLDRLLQAIEAQDARLIASVMLVDADRRTLNCVAAPSIPQLIEELRGLPIGEAHGSCGTSAHRRTPVVVEDTLTSPLFAAYRAPCTRHGLRSSWSMPICHGEHDILGTFAVYGRTPGAPTPEQMQIIEAAVHTAAICLARHRSSELVRASVERLDLALRAAALGVWEWSAVDDRFVWSPECNRILGGDPPSNITCWYQLAHADDRDAVRQAVDQAVANGADFRVEFRRDADEGSTPRWLEIVGRGFGLVGTGSARMVGTVQDVTERRRSAAALATSEERLQFAMRGANDGLWDWNLRTDYLYLSPRWKAMLGYGEHDLPDHLDTWRTLVHPDDREPTLQIAAVSVAGAADNFEAEFRMHHRDGHWIDVLSRAFLVRDRDRKPLRLVGTHVDITARKRAEQALRDSEERLRLLVEASIDAVITIDDRGAIVQWNAEAERMFGRRRADVLGREISTLLLPPADRGSFQQAMRERTATGTSAVIGQRTERSALRADGTEFPIELAVVALRHDERVLYHAYVRDITERRRAEAVRSSLESQLRQAQKMEAIGTLAGGIAHDFNNILAAILGNAELLMLQVDPESREALQAREIRASAHRATALVRQILTFSQHRPPQRQVVDLAESVDDICSMLRSTLPANIQIVRAVDESLPRVLADSTQMHQVLMNLCTNSWHAYGGSPGRIEVGIRRVHVEEPLPLRDKTLVPGTYLRLSVRDHGCGMSDEIQERIFEPFFTTKPQDVGTGLGLAVVHGIVSTHDGAIAVRSAPGTGTEIAIYLPAMEVEPTVVLPKPPAMPTGSGQRVLYVDDESILTDLAQRMLLRLGYRATTFASASAALAAFRADPMAFDALVTDLSMPEMSGLELAASCLELRADLPILLSSGYVAQEIAAKATALGIRHFLAKPNSHRELGEALLAIFTAAPVDVAAGKRDSHR